LIIILPYCIKGTNDRTPESRARKDGCQPEGNRGRPRTPERRKMETNQKRMMAKLDSQLEKMEATDLEVNPEAIAV
jgi:hypothetical protein